MIGKEQSVSSADAYLTQQTILNNRESVSKGGSDQKTSGYSGKDRI